ncbi:MAG TPA: hypothetical protein VGA52_02435, partial [Anaerolineales bacterium]
MNQRKFRTVLGTLVIASVLLAACGTAPPATVERLVTEIVEREVTQVVEVEREPFPEGTDLH